MRCLCIERNVHRWEESEGAEDSGEGRERSLGFSVEDDGEVSVHLNSAEQRLIEKGERKRETEERWRIPISSQR